MPAFAPGPLLRSAHLQSMLASSRVRAVCILLRHWYLHARTREVLLNCGDGVRLQGFYTPAPAGAGRRGLVLLLHGWEGCHRSSYLLSTAVALHRSGYEVFRLNFRDHGDTHHLNRGLFHSCRLDEVLGAAGQIVERYGTRPFHVVGYSLGGNFALRIGLRAAGRGIPVDGIVAVCPVIDPGATMIAMENGAAIYERYFVLKWRRSLRIKQRLFPQTYRLDDWMRLSTLRDQTDYLVRRYAGFPDLQSYLDGYSIAGDRLASLAVPTTIVTAADDPIIPVADFERLVVPPAAALEIQRLGGHCGFLESFFMRSWIDRRIAASLDAFVT